MGYLGLLSLHHLGRNTIGARLQGPKTTECQHYAQAKIKRQISRAAPNRTISKPLTEIHIDWTDLAKAYAGYVRVIFITDAYSGKTFPYFMTSHGKETETLWVLKDFVLWMSRKYNLSVRTIRADNELGRKRTIS
jgi:hypothetical protein